MKSVDFTIQGAPAGKKRPKFTTVNGYTRTYTPADTMHNERLVRACYAWDYHGFKFPPKIPLYVKLTCYYPIPKSTSKKKAAQMEAGEIIPVVKPDLDNVAKLILDALNGLAWEDDNQIARLEISKVYGEDPHTDVHIETIERE